MFMRRLKYVPAVPCAAIENENWSSLSSPVHAFTSSRHTSTVFMSPSFPSTIDMSEDWSLTVAPNMEELYYTTVILHVLTIIVYDEDSGQREFLNDDNTWVTAG